MKKNHKKENHLYPHAPNRALFYQNQLEETLVRSYDLQGNHFLNFSANSEPDSSECEEDPEDRERKKLLPNVIGLGEVKIYMKIFFEIT